MDKRVGVKRVLANLAYLLVRLAVLNLIILVTIVFLSFTRNVIEQTELLLIRFPFQLYIIALFLTNLVYMVGNTFEVVYLVLWEKQIEIKKFEVKFFKAGLLMTVIVCVTGIFMYFIG